MAFTLLIADRNPHVRDFLKREMIAEGYHVQLAKNGRDVLDRIHHDEPLDLLVLDPDLPDVGDLSILERLQEELPGLPIVLHTFLSEYRSHSGVLSAGAFVEKDGSNIDALKTVILEMLRKAYPKRFRGE